MEPGINTARGIDASSVHAYSQSETATNAVCTSGDYARRPPDGAGHHIVDPRRPDEPTANASATVVAPTAMVADALSTAAIVLGPEDGPQFLDAAGVEELLVTGDLELAVTPGLDRYLLEPLRVDR